MADHAWLDRYLAAWVDHVRAGGPGGAPQLATLSAFCAPDIVYEDVPSGSVFTGLDGLASMCGVAQMFFAEVEFVIVTRQVDDRSFAFESTGTGTSTGTLDDGDTPPRPFSLRAASVGTLNADGLVNSHRDYWDMAGLLAQIAAPA